MLFCFIFFFAVVVVFFVSFAFFSLFFVVFFVLFCFVFFWDRYRRFEMILTTTLEIANLSKPKNIADTQRPVVEKGYLSQTILGNFKEIIKAIQFFFFFLVFSLEYQVKGISSLPVMGANGSI